MHEVIGNVVNDLSINLKAGGSGLGNWVADVMLDAVKENYGMLMLHGCQFMVD